LSRKGEGLRTQIGARPVENLVEVKSQHSSRRSCRAVGDSGNGDNRALTSTNISRYQFVKMC